MQHRSQPDGSLATRPSRSHTRSACGREAGFLGQALGTCPRVGDSVASALRSTSWARLVPPTDAPPLGPRTLTAGTGTAATLATSPGNRQRQPSPAGGGSRRSISTPPIARRATNVPLAAERTCTVLNGRSPIHAHGRLACIDWNGNEGFPKPCVADRRTTVRRCTGHGEAGSPEFQISTYADNRRVRPSRQRPFARTMQPRRPRASLSAVQRVSKRLISCIP